jgi:predicted nucleic acid-binding protein
MSEVFLDTAFAIALSSPKDAHHEQAIQISDRLESDATRLITTRAVIIEIGNALAKQTFREAATDLIESLEQDPDAEIISISDELCSRAFDLYCERKDEEWGLTDCISSSLCATRASAQPSLRIATFSKPAFGH